MLVDALGKAANNTLIIFTSYRGEHLGAHGRRGKNTCFEEASRVPLFVVFPGRIEPNTEVNELVSHLDIFSTILDYAGVAEADSSDGKSLRPLLKRRPTTKISMTMLQSQNGTTED
jgi:iduronate 2-sulfatase